MTRIHDELEFQYKGKVNHSLTENLFLVLGVIRYVIYFVFPEKLSFFLLTSETIFTPGTIWRTHFKLTEMKNLRNIKQVHCAARTNKKKFKQATKSGKLNVN